MPVAHARLAPGLRAAADAADVGDVVTAEASSVPDLLHRLETLGVLRENADARWRSTS